MAARLKDEIKQKKEFSGVEEEVILSIMRTADLVSVPLAEALKPAGLTLSQYNVLRILRGAGGEGLPCGEISERMVRRDPDLTRLLDRLESRGLVRRARDGRDRRVVLAFATPEGLDLITSLDGEVEERLRQSLAHVSKQKLRAVADMLAEIRGA